MKNRNIGVSGGFTLVEIMVVVLLIGIIVAVAIPNIVSARVSALRNTCIANLKQIDAAIVVYSLNTDERPSDMSDLVPTYIKNNPVCPAGGIYDISGDTPVCSVSGHELS